jgi:outer membrane receptor protein involved in Fe transport
MPFDEENLILLDDINGETLMVWSRPARGTLGTTAGLCLGLLAPTYVAAQPSPNPVTSYPATYFASMGLNTAYDMVLRLPGFTFDDGSAVRGLAGAEGNVLIDGRRPASKTDDLYGVLQRLPAGQVERIDVIRGGAPGIDMSGKTIVANVIRRKAKGFSGVVQYAQYKPEHIAIDPQARLEATWTDGDHIVSASAFWKQDHDLTETPGPHKIFTPDGKLLDHSSMENAAPNRTKIGTLGYEGPLWGGHLQTKLTLEDQPYDLTSIDRFQFAGLETEHSVQDTRDGELSLHYDRDLSRSLSLELIGLQHLSHTNYTSSYDDPSDAQFFSVGESGGESIGRAVLHWNPTPTFVVDSGGEYAFNWLKTRTLFTDNGATIVLPASDVRVEEGRVEPFATLTWRPTSTLSLEAGVHLERSTLTSSGDLVLSKTLTYAKPRAVLSWSPEANDQVRLRVEREVGQLNFNYFAATATLNGPGVFPGNPNLLPQTDWAFEAAWDHKFGRDSVVSLTVRRMALQNIIDQIPAFTPTGVFNEPGNIGGGSETDVLASFSIPLSALHLQNAKLHGQATWRASKVIDPTTGQARQISGQHPLDTELHFDQDIPKWKLSWGIDGYATVRSKTWYFDEIDSVAQGGGETIYVEYKPRPDLSVRLEFDNINRASYDLRRDIYAGLRGQDPLQSIDVQQHRGVIYSLFKVRKTFGGGG